MIRDTLFTPVTHRDTPFTWRGDAPTRLEALTDAVFGFAITLLIVSLEVPNTYTELLEAMRGFVPFAIGLFAMLYLWHCHHLYFRRFALHDRTVTILNGVLLFVILFYTFPLKFLATFLFNLTTGHYSTRGAANAVVPIQEAGNLLIIYCAGYFLVFGVLFSLYVHAFRRRADLHLTPEEIVATRRQAAEYFAHVAIASLVAFTAALLPAPYAGLSGMLFFLVGLAVPLALKFANRPAVPA